MINACRRRTASSAARVREHRARARRNAMLVTIEVPAGLPDALAEAGFLQEWDTENPAEIRKAIERLPAETILRVIDS